MVHKTLDRVKIWFHVFYISEMLRMNILVVQAAIQNNIWKRIKTPGLMRSTQSGRANKPVLVIKYKNEAKYLLMCYLHKHKKIPILAFFTWFLILGKIQDGG